MNDKFVDGLWSKCPHSNRRINTMLGAFLVGAGIMHWYTERNRLRSLTYKLDRNKIKIHDLTNTLNTLRDKLRDEKRQQIISQKELNEHTQTHQGLMALVADGEQQDGWH